MKTKLLILLTLLSVIFLKVKAQRIDTSNSGLTTLPNADIYDVNGVHTTLHQLAKNKVLIVDCWFIPCPQCFMAMNILHKFYDKYRNNKNVRFITVCMTDSGLVKKFIAQDTVMRAYVEQYQYFSNLKAFKLPVYFINGCSSKVPLGTKKLSHYAPDDKSKCPDVLFKFVGYPNCMIFDKSGKMVFQHSGFDNAENYQQNLTNAMNLAVSDLSSR